jgi:hypothetical protein
MCGMFLAEKHLAVLEERLAEARPRILEQYHRILHAAGGDETRFNSVVLVNMLFTFSFMRDQLLVAQQRQHPA